VPTTAPAGGAPSAASDCSSLTGSASNDGPGAGNYTYTITISNGSSSPCTVTGSATVTLLDAGNNQVATANTGTGTVTIPAKGSVSAHGTVPDGSACSDQASATSTQVTQWDFSFNGNSLYTAGVGPFTYYSGDGCGDPNLTGFSG